MDADGTGPGMLIAAEVIKALFRNGIPCFSALMTPTGADWNMFRLRFDGRRAKGMVLVALLSRPFFHSIPCLREVNYAVDAKAEILPVVIESNVREILGDKKSMWPESLLEQKAGGKVAELRDLELLKAKAAEKFSKFNTLPQRGDLLSDEKALIYLIETVRRALGHSVADEKEESISRLSKRTKFEAKF